MISIARARELLGAEAEGKTDEEIAAIRDRFDAFAGAFLALCDDRAAQRRQSKAATESGGSR